MNLLIESGLDAACQDLQPTQRIGLRRRTSVALVSLFHKFTRLAGRLVREIHRSEGKAGIKLETGATLVLRS